MILKHRKRYLLQLRGYWSRPTLPIDQKAQEALSAPAKRILEPIFINLLLLNFKKKHASLPLVSFFFPKKNL
jgi:hypothetical protein